MHFECIDIHNMKVSDAKRKLEDYINNINCDICEIKVIHGYRHGTELQKMVRLALKSKYIKSRFKSLNPGETTLIIKKDRK